MPEVRGCAASESPSRHVDAGVLLPLACAVEMKLCKYITQITATPNYTTLRFMSGSLSANLSRK